nr:GyrI-like domain-containing protein [Bacillus velezensis]
MNITIEELPESRIAYFRNVGEYGGKQNKELMESFKNWAQLNGLLDYSVILGIPQDHPNRTPKRNAAMMFVLLSIKTIEAVSGFWNTVFSEIEKNNLSIREQPIIERYTLQKVNHHLCEILIPIQ